MSKENTKIARIERLKNTQAARQENARHQVNQAIESIRKMGGKINFHSVARVANVSISYLYKYPDIKQYITSLRSQSEAMPQAKSSTSVAHESDSKVISRLKQRLMQLENDKQELKRQNEALAGQVYRVHSLQEQVKRQQQIIEDLHNSLKSAQSQLSETKITPITKVVINPGQNQQVASSVGNKVNTQSTISEQIQSELKAFGISLNSTLRRKILSHPELVVVQAIEALKQAIENGNTIHSPGAWLSTAIDDQWVKNESIFSSNDSPNHSYFSLEFEQWYTEAIAIGFVLDVPINHLNLDRYNQPLVKVNKPGIFGAPYRETLWIEAKAEMDSLQRID
ncbi:MAG: DUF6262 family protein [Fischerella sp. CENA71]|nr:DUF6262 family protein [Fischerella sp. CENA71]